MNLAILHSIRLLKHELKRGELTIIALAIVLSVSAVFSLSGFSHQIKQSLLENSAKFIASDRVLKSPRPVDEAFLSKAHSFRISTVKQVEMASMVFAGDDMLLTQIRVTTQGYPLRGELWVKTSATAPETLQSTPKKGQIWLDKKAFSSLNVNIGEYLDVGNARLLIAGMITQLPDASFSVFGAAPVVLMNFQDLAATNLIQPGSRVGYRYLFAGEEDDLSDFAKWLKPQLNETQHWQNIKSGNSPLAKSLIRAELYLSLSSMLGIVLAAVAVAVASRRYGQRHQATVAIFKAMGATKRHVIHVYAIHWSMLCLLSISVGLLIGFGLLKLGLWGVSHLFEVTSKPQLLEPLMIAIVTGCICALAFALQPLTALVNTSPMLILRGKVQVAHNAVITALLSFVAVFILLYMFSQNVMLSLALLGGALAVSVIILLLGLGFMRLSRAVGVKAGKAWHLALANLKRRGKENAIQLISFTIAIKLLLVIVVMKNAIIDEWQAQLPENAPNRFLINISHYEKQQFESFIAENNITSSGLYPVVRGRLSAINGEKVRRKVSKEDQTEADNGRQGVGRELNLTWRSELPKQNTIKAGSWWFNENKAASSDTFDNSASTHQVSIESSLAERLNIHLGDELSFTIGSDVIQVFVSNIREVNWQSLQPSFFMILHPSVLSDFPATYITSLKLTPSHDAAFKAFLSQHPTISVLDVDAMINQLREVIGQVSVAIQFILLLVLLAGALVLIAQVQASMEERERELAILKTLGAKGRMLSLSVFYEFLALGALAGFMASIAMELAVYIIQRNVFDMQASFHFQYWLLGIAVGASFVSAIGIMSCRRLLTLSSVQLIRRTM